MKKSITSFADTALTREQQRGIVGGAYYDCQCDAGVGTWSGNYKTTSDVTAAIGRHCTGGIGHCTPRKK